MWTYDQANLVRSSIMCSYISTISVSCRQRSLYYFMTSSLNVLLDRIDFFMKTETADKESPATAITHLQKQYKPQDSHAIQLAHIPLQIDKSAAVKPSQWFGEPCPHSVTSTSVITTFASRSSNAPTSSRQTRSTCITYSSSVPLAVSQRQVCPYTNLKPQALAHQCKVQSKLFA